MGRGAWRNDQEGGDGDSWRSVFFQGRQAKRTYFFNVKETRTGDVFLNIVESSKIGEDRFERRSVIVFKEDLAPFLDAFQSAVKFIKAG